MAIPNEGAAYLLNLLKSNNATLYIGVMIASPTDTSTGAACSEVVAATGAYNRIGVAAANWTVATDTISVAAGALPVEFTGFTHTGSIGYAGIFLGATGNTLVAYGALATGGRQLTNIADKLQLTALSFQLT